jgi:hypothetical protein
MLSRSISLLFVGACAVNYANPEPLENTLGTSHAEQTQSITPLGDAPRMISSEAAQRLLSATHELAHAGPENEHARLVCGLERLADALDEVAPARATERVRLSAYGLERSWTRSIARGDVVRAGLEGAGRVVAQLEPASSDRAEARKALLVSSEATASIDPNRAVVEQYSEIGLAFRETVRALLVATGDADLDAKSFPIPRGSGDDRREVTEASR